MTLAIMPLDPSDAAGLAAWYELESVVIRHDIPGFPDPNRPRHMRRFEWPWAGRPERAFLAWDNERLVGFAYAMLPMDDNTSVLFVEIAVHPEHRRRGIGTALLAQINALARAEKRDLIEATAVAALPGGDPRSGAGAAFLNAFGKGPALENVRRRLTVDPDDDRRLADLAEYAQQHASGYAISHWSGACTDEVVDDLARLESRLALDAPTGDLYVEPEAIDRHRIRADETTRAGRGDRTFRTIVTHELTAEVAGTTMLAMDDGDDRHAWQLITLVDPAHRGHRLGLLLKLANLSYARGSVPSLCEVDTWNALTNTHMISVNEQMGFSAVDQWLVWQLPVPTAP